MIFGRRRLTKEYCRTLEELYKLRAENHALRTQLETAEASAAQEIGRLAEQAERLHVYVLSLLQLAHRSGSSEMDFDRFGAVAEVGLAAADAPETGAAPESLLRRLDEVFDTGFVVPAENKD